MKFSEESKKATLKYIVDTITHICKTIGPRESGTASELAAQKFFKKELEDNAWVDEAELEHFPVARHGLVGFTKIIGVLLIIAGLLQLSYFAKDINMTAYIACNAVSFILVALSLMTTFFEFIIYKKFIDRFLSITVSSNVYAKLKPQGEVKRRIVFNGHTDSAYEWTLMKIHQTFMVVMLAAAILSNVAFISSITCLFIWQNVKWLQILTLAIGLFSILSDISLFYVCTYKVLSPGANDNLTGVLISMGVLKCIKDNNIKLQNTEVCVMLSGSEECGLRGAQAWGKLHKNELNEVDTAVIVFDTLKDYDYCTIYSRDMTMTVKSSPKVVNLLDKACEQIGHPLPHHGVPFGSSDAAALNKLGINACCLAAQNPHGTDYYHNRTDGPEKLDERTIALGLDIALNALDVFDREGFGE